VNIIFGFRIFLIVVVLRCRARILNGWR